MLTAHESFIKRKMFRLICISNLVKEAFVLFLEVFGLNHSRFVNLRSVFLVSVGMLLNVSAYAAGPQQHLIPVSIQVAGELPVLPADTTDLKFKDFFKMPVGPKGLELNEKLIALNGKRVRVVGYMARAETPTPGMFVFAPLPIDLGDEDESLSDDLPPSSIFVHTESSQFVFPYINGLIKLSGVLSVGNQDEADGHVSMVRLQLDQAITQDVMKELERTQASK